MSATFFSHVRRKRAPALVKKFVRDLESGLFATPKSFDVFSRFRTEELKLDRKRDLLQVSFPENALILAFYDKYPQAKAKAIALDSFDPPVAKCFALRQLQLMQGTGAGGTRLPASEAFAQVEQEMESQLQALTRQILGTNIPQLQLMQTEEERHLRDAAVAVAEGRLPVEARGMGGNRGP